MKHHEEEFQCNNCRIIFTKKMYEYTVRPKFCGKKCYMVVLRRTREQQKWARTLKMPTNTPDTNDDRAMKFMTFIVAIIVLAVAYVHIWCR